MKEKSSNVKFSQKYERFGEIIRYLTLDELNQFFSSVMVVFNEAFTQSKPKIAVINRMRS